MLLLHARCSAEGHLTESTTTTKTPCRSLRRREHSLTLVEEEDGDKLGQREGRCTPPEP